MCRRTCFSRRHLFWFAIIVSVVVLELWQFSTVPHFQHYNALNSGLDPDQMQDVAPFPPKSSLVDGRGAREVNHRLPFASVDGGHTSTSLVSGDFLAGGLPVVPVDGGQTSTFAASEDILAAGLPAVYVDGSQSSTSLVSGDVQTADGKALKPESVWIFCAGQNGECTCRGKMRWGNFETWHEKMLDTEEKEIVVKCSIKVFPDVLPGDFRKHCECLVRSGSYEYHRINPALLPEGDVDAHQVSSCEIFKTNANDNLFGAMQWEAVKGLCDESAADRAGQNAISPDTLRHLLRAWVEPRFLRSYRKFYNSSGWIGRAFVNYFAGGGGGKLANITEKLIESVHLFSSELIIVFHFGMNVVETWTPERFPQLLIFNAAPIPSDIDRSFSFNKLRAILMARVCTGIILDSDQFVAPGVDDLFVRTEQEITKAYPLPIMPVHFLDWGPNDHGPGGLDKWPRYCLRSTEANAKERCIWQTLRWGHAHPSWTYWALPFVGKWLRRNFRDEWLPPRTRSNGNMSALRVWLVLEDEDLLNIGTWEDGGTKQWCKFDSESPFLFNSITKNPRRSYCKEDHYNGVLCDDVWNDARFYPQGSPRVFWTAHAATDPVVTRDYLHELSELHRHRQLPPPILYNSTFYKSGYDLLKEHPNVKCLV